MRISRSLFVLLLAMVLVATAQTADSSTEDILTREERAWLANNPVIRLAPERSYAPFSFVATPGKLEGLSIDYLRLVEQKLGVKFQIVEGNNLDTILKMARRGQIDTVTSLMKTPERSEYLLFTSAYISVPAVIITKKEIAGTLSLARMETSKIAVGRGYAVKSFLDKNYPGLHLVSADDDTACLKMLSFGEVDAAVVDLASASHIIDTLKITNLRVAGDVGFKYELCFASRQDWPILNQIMDKAIAQISKTEQGSINSRWLSLGQPAPFVSRTVWITTLSLLAVLLMIIVGVILWNRTRKREQEARRESEERLKREQALSNAIIDSIPGTFYMLDESGRYARWNSYQRDEIVGKPDDQMTVTNAADTIHPDDRALIGDKIANVLGNGVEEIVEGRVLLRGGPAFRWLLMTGRQIKIDGRPFLVGTGIDITEHKRMGQETKLLEERLQRSEKMESLGTLAGGVAHDLNNVLGIIVGYSELILDSVDESSPIKSHLVNIMNGGQKAAAIVDDLVTLARRGVQGRSIVNPNKIVAECQKSPELANLSSHHPAVKIIADLETDLLNISGSTIHLGKSLYNLISNASEAMPKGGTVTIKTTNQYLDKPIQGYDEVRQGDYVVLSVSDTGEGIPDADLKRIFEPFYTKKIMGRSGTGLGLAVVWGTVKDHNGYINLESEEGKGSTFTLYFPVTREAVTTEATAVPIAEYMGKGETVLIVDDVEEQRNLAVGMLQKLNYNLSSVASGEEAVEYLKEHEVDLMVLDMIMDPGMDGLDTYKQVLEIRPKQKAIIVSGFSESDRVKTAEGLGVGAYVRKPYIKEKLGLSVRKELDRVV